MERVILHCDLNCFFASVELLDHPELRDVPVAVCGDPSVRHGIILAKNEPAKRCGVQTAETIWQAKKKCPELVLLPPHHGLYAEYSRKVNALYNDYTDLVEPFGIDESWLDVTHTLHLFGGDARALADTIRERVRRELGLTISVGVSFNKVFAKLGSDYKKPDATTVISPENWRALVWPLPVESLLYVGRAATAELARHSVRTIGQLAAMSPETLEAMFGKLGLQLHRCANGQDSARVLGEAERPPVKSVGNSTTFSHDLTTWDELRTGAALLSDSVAMRLRQHGLYCGGVSIAVKNSRFQTVSKQKRLTHSTHLMREINDAALELLRLAWRAPDPVRLLSVTAMYLTNREETYEQLDLLSAAPQKQEKQERLESAMDKIRGKYGRTAISFATPTEPKGSVKEE